MGASVRTIRRGPPLASARFAELPKRSHGASFGQIIRSTETLKAQIGPAEAKSKTNTTRARNADRAAPPSAAGRHDGPGLPRKPGGVPRARDAQARARDANWSACQRQHSDLAKRCRWFVGLHDRGRPPAATVPRRPTRAPPHDLPRPRRLRPRVWQAASSTTRPPQHGDAG